MGGGAVKALHILVEDEVAKAVLREIVRLSDPQFLKVIGVHAVGDKGTIQRTMQALVGKGIPIAAVRDGDVGQNTGQNLFSLPGTEPPEKEILQKCPEVRQMLLDGYGLDLADFMVGADQTSTILGSPGSIRPLRVRARLCLRTVRESVLERCQQHEETPLYNN